MLNRIFVLLGVLVILAIGGAFVVPRLIQWGDYRPRLESMASHAFGTEVAIEGDIHLTLLPQPQLDFTKVRVGPAGAPVLTVASVSADFSLFDFLRDQYKVTRLELDKPELHLGIAADGTLATGIAIAESPSDASVAIANADVVDGTIAVADARAGTTSIVSAVNGTLRLDALHGPFAFQGDARYGGTDYGVRITTGTFDAKGDTALSLALRDAVGGLTVESSGNLSGGVSPRYAGDLKVRLAAPKPATADATDVGRGDFVLEGKLEAATDKILVTEYTALPDENRAATRLTGAAEIGLGKTPRFKAVISGGVVALPPRDATKELTDPPYELVRLLDELPGVPVPPLPGSIGLDVSELNLRSVSLRDLRLDAETDGTGWTLKTLSATLPGATQLTASGALTMGADRPAFTGAVTLKSSRLDQLAQLWRKPGTDTPLLGIDGALSAKVTLGPDLLQLADGRLSLNGLTQNFAAEIGFAQPRRLKLVAHVTSVGETESTALGALLPDIAASGSFGATFPKGEIDVSASAATIFGLAGADLAAKASWDGGVVEFSELSAGDLGGAAFDAKLTAFGTLLKPEVSGAANVKISDGAPIVGKLLDAVQTPPAVADFLRLSLPAQLTLQLDAPTGDGGQNLRVDGQLGTATTQLTARLSAGIASALTAPLTASLDLSSQSPQLMTRQLGLGEVPLLDDGTPLQLSVNVEGAPDKPYTTHVSLQGGSDHLTFDGKTRPGDFTQITGEGKLDLALSDPSVLIGLLGGEGLHLPALTGTAKLQFQGLDSIALDDLSADGATGRLAMVRRGDTPGFSGTLHLAALDPVGLWPALAGPAATVGNEGIWPSGPIDIGAIARTSEGRVDVSVDRLAHAGGVAIDKANFGYDWDGQNIHLRNLTGAIGGGTVTLDATLCCATSSADKDLSGRIGLAGVDLDAIVPGPVAAVLDGKLSGAASFDAPGTSLAAMVASASGSGSYSIAGFSAAKFAPTVFATADTMQGIIEMAPETLTSTITDDLATAPFASPDLTGSFTLVGGTLRSPNLAIEGTGARIFGGLTLALKDLGLDGRYAMTALGQENAKAFDPAVAEVTAEVGGTLFEPTVRYDVSGLTDNMTIKANEAELAILEQRKAEADARAKAEADANAKAAADEKARQDAAAAAAAAAAAQKAADEKARQDAAAAAAAAAAAQKAADDEAAKKAAAEAARRAAAPPSAPIDLGL